MPNLLAHRKRMLSSVVDSPNYYTRKTVQPEHDPAQTLRDTLIAEKRCVRCGLHCPKRYDHMKSHLCGDCFWNS
jgi:hypothetical protein